MPTQKEVLEDIRLEVEYLADSIQSSSSPVEVYSPGLESSVDNLASAIKEGAWTILAGILGGVLIGGYIYFQARALEYLLEVLQELNKKNAMIKSIQSLQKRHPHLTYKFAIERSYALGADRQERQTILNGLIIEGIVTEYGIGGATVLKIDPDSPDLIDHWDRVDEVFNKLKQLKQPRV